MKKIAVVLVLMLSLVGCKDPLDPIMNIDVQPSISK